MSYFGLNLQFYTLERFRKIKLLLHFQSKNNIKMSFKIIR